MDILAREDTIKTTLDEYLGERGLSAPISNYMIDKMRIPHGQTERQKKQMEREAMKAAKEYQERRAAAIQEYKQKVAAGEIEEKSSVECLIDNANGHPDNLSVQAARRLLAKKGIAY